MSLNKWYRTVNELQPAGVEWLHPTDITQFTPPDEESLVSQTENAFERCHRREQEEIVQRAMTCLSERERRLVTLYYHRELTMKEIGKELGVDE
jgi:RNA polymerase sigma factor (sigma-70 family)